MADKKSGGWAGHVLPSLIQWGAERIASNWQGLLALIGFGGGGMTFAALSDALRPWFPFSWFAAGLLAALVGACLLWVINKSREVAARSAVWREASRATHSINPLQGEFTRETISLSGLMNPVGVPVSDKVFVECDFIGPGLIVLSGGDMRGGPGTHFGNVEYIELAADAPVNVMPNKLVLVNCTIRRCKFYNLVIAVTPDSADVLRQSGVDRGWLTRRRNEPEAGPAARQA